jgi:hypothetical protein
LPFGSRATTLIVEIYLDRLCVVFSLSNQRKAFLASFSGSLPIGAFSVTIIILGYVLLGSVNGWPLFSYTAIWRAICLKPLISEEKKQKTSAKGKRRRE